MRTTLTLDADVAERLEQEIRRSGKGMKAIVNQWLRIGSGQAQRAIPEPFRVEAQDLGLKPGIDPNRMNQLVDELEVQEFQRRNQG